jgi:hypothetical protein
MRHLSQPLLIAFTALALLRTASAAEPAPQPSPRFNLGTQMKLTEIGDKTITVVSTLKRDEADPKPQVLKLDEKTDYFIGKVAGERKDPKGRVARSVRFERCERGALEVGQILLVAIDGDRATRVSITPPLVVDPKKPDEPKKDDEPRKAEDPKRAEDPRK